MEQCQISHSNSVWEMNSSGDLPILVQVIQVLIYLDFLPHLADSPVLIEFHHKMGLSYP